MSDASGSYALKQGKFVDRRVLVELLRHLSAHRSLRDYLYIGLGGLSLEDHKAMHRDLGITKSISLDRDELTVRRQVFNRPFEGIKCLCMTTTTCVSEFWPTVQKAGFAEETPVIVWLDYTSPSEIFQQLQEIQSVTRVLKAGDVLRVTFNANPTAYAGPGEGEMLMTDQVKRERRLITVQERLAEFLPPTTTADQVTRKGLPLVLAGAFRLAVQRTLGISSDTEYRLLSIVRYADGQQMMTITGIFLARGTGDHFIMTTGLGEWDFFSAGWGDIHSIEVPELTLRERLFIEQIDVDQFNAEDTALAIKEKPEDLIEAIRLYQQLYRHFPQFHHIQF